MGVIILLAGIVFMANPADSYYTSSPDEASFGGDYYTYQYEATSIAARNAAVAANNLREIGGMLAIYYGSSLVLVGVLMMFHYGKKLALETEVPAVPAGKKETEAPAQEEAVSE